MTEELHALTGDGLMGRVLWDRRRDRLAFRYEAEWRNNDASYPLSLSMPLAAVEHGHKTWSRSCGDCCPTMTECSSAGVSVSRSRRGMPFTVSGRSAHSGC